MKKKYAQTLLFVHVMSRTVSVICRKISSVLSVFYSKCVENLPNKLTRVNEATFSEKYYKFTIVLPKNCVSNDSCCHFSKGYIIVIISVKKTHLNFVGFGELE